MFFFVLFYVLIYLSFSSRTPMESLHQGFREGTESKGEKLKIVNKCLLHSKKTDKV